MKIGNKIFFIGLSLMFVVLLLFVFYYENIQIAYIRLFKITKLVTHENRNGKVEGESVFYLNGNISIKGRFKNGLKDGPVIRFYNDGVMENKTNYVNDKREGK